MILDVLFQFSFNSFISLGLWVSSMYLLIFLFCAFYDDIDFEYEFDFVESDSLAYL